MCTTMAVKAPHVTLLFMHRSKASAAAHDKTLNLAAPDAIFMLSPALERHDAATESLTECHP
jgi:hypothetical protein